MGGKSIADTETGSSLKIGGDKKRYFCKRLKPVDQYSGFVNVPGVQYEPTDMTVRDLTFEFKELRT